MRLVVAADHGERAAGVELGFQRGDLALDQRLGVWVSAVITVTLTLVPILALVLLEHDARRVAEPEHEHVGEPLAVVDVRRREQRARCRRAA